MTVAFIRKYFHHTQAKKSKKRSLNLSKLLLIFVSYSYAAGLACLRLNIQSNKDILEEFPETEDEIFASLVKVLTSKIVIIMHGIMLRRAISQKIITMLDARGPKNRKEITRLLVTTEFVNE